MRQTGAISRGGEPIESRMSKIALRRQWYGNPGRFALHAKQLRPAATARLFDPLLEDGAGRPRQQPSPAALSGISGGGIHPGSCRKDLVADERLKRHLGAAARHRLLCP